MLSKTVRIVFSFLVAFCLLYNLTSSSAGAGNRNIGRVQAAANIPANAAGVSAAVLLYSQPHDGTGTLLPSSRLIGNNNDADQYVWDDFTLSSTRIIGEVRWRGARNMALNTGGPVQYFTIEIYQDLAWNSPNVVAPPLHQYQTPGNASETLAGTFNGVALYDYDVVLPTAFAAQAKTRYWLKIEAFQNLVPDWGIALGTGGAAGYFRRRAVVGDTYDEFVGSGGSAFSLYQPGSISYLYLPVVHR